MGLYTRDLARGKSDTSADSRPLLHFIKQTYQLFAASLMAGAVGAFTTMGYAETISKYNLILFIIEIALLFGIHFVKKMPGINMVVMFLFTFMTGVSSVPILHHVLNTYNGGFIVGNAFAMTSAIVAVMSYIGIKTEKDLRAYSKFFMVSIIIIVIASLINVFVGSPITHTIIGAITAIIFSLMVAYDTQNIVKGHYETPIDGALGLYIDFINIFLSLIQIFTNFGSDD